MRYSDSRASRYTFYLLLVITLFIRPFVDVSAQQPTPSDNDVNAIASQLYCPVCENTPLDVCPTEACRQWRELIRQMLAEGKSSGEIEQYFVENYGGRVLAIPPRTGLNWLVYVLPPLAFLAGAVLLFWVLRTWKRRGQKTANETAAGAGSGSEPATDEYVLRLEAELRKRK
jgi:cytochrome c-type biogenesis protein CcmH